MMTSRLKVLLSLLVVVIVIAFGVSFYLGIHQVQAPTMEIAVQPDQSISISNINKYTDAVNHFSFEYPASMSIFETNTDTTNPNFGRYDPPDVIDLRSIPYGDAPGGEFADFFIQIKKNPNDCLTLPTVPAGYPSYSYFNVSTTTINGVNFFSYSSSAPETVQKYTPYIRFYDALYGGRCYMLYEFANANDANYLVNYSKQIVPTLEQVAHTFTFIQ